MNASFVRSYAEPSTLPQEGLPQVAIFGRSNSGKSSLINSLTERKDLARTSSEPGQTKLINIFDFSGKFHLVDLPGYGYSKGSKRQSAALFDIIDGYLEHSKLLKLAIVIVDSRLGPTVDDQELMMHLENLGIPIFLVFNKIDKLSRSELNRDLDSLRSKYKHTSIFPHSSVTSIGRGVLLDAITNHISSK